jgi:tetratricopeptide (TPR) repeat protein
MTDVAGVEAVSADLLGKVTQYHAAIGEGVPRAELIKLENRLLEEARKECLAQHYEEALNLFTHALAVTEKSKSENNSDPGLRGTLVHNIAFCLHCKSEFEAAKAYYEQSLEMFKRVSLPMHQKVLNGILYPERLAYEAVYGGLNHNRIQMTKERLLDVSFGRLPNLTQLDQYGRKKAMPEGEQKDSAASPASVGDAWSPPPASTGQERRPGWLAVAQDSPAFTGAESEPTDAEEAAKVGAPSSAPLSQDGRRSDAEEEAARKEWLQYYMQTGEWEQAAELVISVEEQEDLEYLREREARQGKPTP